MTDWQEIKLGSGCTMFLASDQTLHSVPSDVLWMAYDIDPALIVLADSPEGWREFVRETIEMAMWWAGRDTSAIADQRWYWLVREQIEVVETEWAKRKLLTAADRTMLADMGIRWDK